MKITAILIFLVLVVAAASTSSLISGQQAQSSSVTTPVIEIQIKKGDVALLDFFQLINTTKTNAQLDPSNVITIATVPNRGSIYVLPKDMRKSDAIPTAASLIGASPRRRRAKLLRTFNQAITKDNIDSNLGGTGYRGLFLYRTATSQNNSLIFDAYEETFKYAVYDGNNMGPGPFLEGTVLVHVYNTPPRVPPMPIIKTVRTSVGDNAKGTGYDIYTSKVLKALAATKIPFTDPDVVLCGYNEIASITIDDKNIVGNACKIKTVTGDKEIADGVVLTSSELKVYATFNNDGYESENKRCQFQYRVKDSSGAEAPTLGTLQFKLKNPDSTKNQPKVFDREYRYYPTKQKFLVISLSSYGDAQSAVTRDIRDLALSPNNTNTKIKGVQIGVRPADNKLPSASDENGYDDDVTNGKAPLGKRVFYVTRYPGIGKLYALPKFSLLNSDPKFLQDHEVKNTPNSADGKNIIVYSGTQRRFHLLYKLESSVTPEQLKKIINTNETFGWKVRSVDGIMSREATVTITFRENNRAGIPLLPGELPKNGTVQVRGLQCGVRDFNWVFWNRVVRNVNLNYSLPVGDKVNRIIMASTFGSPLMFGKMYASGSKIFEYNQQNRSKKNRELRAGDAVILEDSRWPKLKFVPTPVTAKKLLDSTPNAQSKDLSQTFNFKVQTRFGSQCLATVVFHLKKHEQTGVIIKNPETGEMQKNANVVFDTAPYGRYSVFALSGKYSTTPEYSRVKIVSSPRRGMLFRINADRMPYDEKMTSQDSSDPSAESYCNRHQCENFVMHPRLRRGTFVSRQSLVSRRNDDAISDDRFWVMYRAPWKRSFKSEKYTMDYDENDPRAMDSFTIQFCKSSGDDCAPETFLYQVHLFEGSLRRIYVPFVKNSNPTSSSSQNSQNITTFDDMTVVPITLGQSKKDTLVRILDFDKERRHGIPPEFRLYQAKRNGGDSFDFGPALASSTDTESGIVGNLINTENSDENTILLVPNDGTRFQNFRFRARLYNRSLLRNIDKINYADDNKMQLMNVFEDVRVIAIRQNSPPQWNVSADDAAFGDVPVGKSVSASFQVVDKENDLITFIVKKAPRHSDLFIFYTLFGKGQHVLARDGLRFTAPRGSSDFRSWLVVEFRPRYEVELASNGGKGYPVNDSFVLLADDGSGILTEPLTVTSRIIPPLKGWTGDFDPEKRKDLLTPNSSQSSSSHVLALLVVLVVIAVGTFSVYYIKKRKLLREQFSKLANFDNTEMA